MPLIISVFVFVLGLSFGSFLNVVIFRLEQNEGVGGRSYCPHCKHQLSWLDLVPVFSFLWLRGKCRYCKQKISWQYPLVEVSTGLIFLLISNSQFLISNEISNAKILETIFLWYIASSLIVIFTYDLKHFLIPDVVLLPAIIVTFLYRILENLVHWKLIENWELIIGNYLLAALIASSFFLLIFLASRGRWMGFGDVKLAILMGLLLGLPNIFAALFLAFLGGAIIGIGLMLLHEKGLKSEVPFAPFLIVGTALAYFFGNGIIAWYMSLFLP